MMRRLQSRCGSRRTWWLALVPVGAGLLLTATLWALVPSDQVAKGQIPLPPTDLPLALSQGSGQTPAAAPVQLNAEPRLAATPRIPCGAGSNTLSGVDGRVTAADLASPAASKGY